MAIFCLAYVSPRTRLFYALGFILMGIVIEFLQGMTSYRTFDPFDMLANSIGVAGAWLVASYVRIGR